MNYETLLEDLHAVRDRAGRFRLRVADEQPAGSLLGGALEELDVALEELRVTEEEVRAQQEALAAGGQRSEVERKRYQALFVLAPAAYLVTDPVGVIREANLRGAALLGVDRRFVAGKLLASFVHSDDRGRFRDRLSRLARGEEGADWRTRLQPRGLGPLPVGVSVAVGRDRAGVARELRWLLWPPPGADLDPAAAAPVLRVLDRPASPLALDDLAATLHEVADSAAQLVGADGAGLMLADQAGGLREGPCVDAFVNNELVRSVDLRADPRWPRLAPAVASNQIRGVLSVPVAQGDEVLGTCNALTHQPRGWTDADSAAIVAFAAVIGRLLRTATEARRKGDLTAQAAFERLRRQARARSRRIEDLAREVIAGRPPPSPGER